MANPERRKGKLTGRWWADFSHKGARFKHAFPTLAEADGYEAYVRATGTEPPHHVKAASAAENDAIARRARANSFQ